MEITVNYEYKGSTFLPPPGLSARFYGLPDMADNRRSAVEKWAECQLACMLAVMVAEVFSCSVKSALTAASTEYVRTVAGIIKDAADSKGSMSAN